MNWPTLLIPRIMFGSPAQAAVVWAEAHPAAARLAKRFKSTVTPAKSAPGGGAMEVILLGTGGPRPDPRRMATTTLIRLGE